MSDKRVKEVNQWFVFPDNLNPSTFRGYITKNDITNIPGGFPVGQNVEFTDGMTPTIRPGSKIIGTEKSGTSPIKRAWRFERRDGVEIEMRAYSTKVDFLINGVMDEYSDLLNGLTDGLEFCFAVISKSTIVPSYVYFCNGQEDWYKWTGAYAQYQSDNGSDEITVDQELSKGAYLESGQKAPDFYNAFYTVSDGSFRITIDGVDYNIDGMDFTSESTPAGVASVIQTAIQAATGGNETVTYDSDTRKMTIRTSDGSGSSISYATTSTGTVGTDVSGVGSTYTKFSENRSANVFDREVYNFNETGTIVINGEVITYTNVKGFTFVGCTSIPTTPTNGDVIVQEPETAQLADFRSSVGIAHEGRIHARLETKKSVSNYSKLDDPDDWTTGSSDGDGGAKEIEQGGPITAYGRDEERLYIFKKRQIKILEFNQAGDRVDVPVYKNLKPADDKSTTTGAIGQKSTFHSPNGILFVTEDRELVHLTRETGIDYPQLVSISDPISPTFKNGVHDEASGIVYKSKVYYSFKQTAESVYNDVVIVYDLIRGIWHTPYVGWNVGDWTIINNKLRWHSSINQNTYELQTDLLDKDSAYTTILRTHSENFGEPIFQKTVDMFAVEIYLSDNFAGTLTILYDDDGFTDRTEIEIDLENNKSDNKKVLAKDNYHLFGSEPFGAQRFGSNDDLSELKRHIFIIPLKANIQFFNISAQLSTNKKGVNYEMVRYAYHLATLIQLAPSKFIKNITT